MKLFTTRIATPLGDMIAVAHDDALVLLDFHDRRDIDTALRQTHLRFGVTDDCNECGDHPVLNQARVELTDYFAGRRTVFSVLLNPPGHANSFERRAWDYLRAIPFGETRTYGHQATTLGSTGAARAVGRANGQNFLSVVIPCHRVVAASGDLTGYGGGVERKRWLLDHEQKIAGGDLWATATSLATR